jgi:DNA-binding transcriptional ArsR family regulator
MSDALRLFKVELFKALGHPVRLRLLEVLGDGERTVSELQAALGVDGSAVSQHLMLLRARDLVEARRAGANVYHRVRHPRVFAIMAAGRDIYADRLGELQASLDADARPEAPAAAEVTI